jgi:hypothetical protein
MDAIQQDATEFGNHARAGGWRMGLLVARNVEKGSGEGRYGANRNDRYGNKISAQAFAKIADTSAPRVLRYLDAWESAAEAGHVPAAETLSPGDEVELDAETLPAWDEFYDGRAPAHDPAAFLNDLDVSVAPDAADGTPDGRIDILTSPGWTMADVAAAKEDHPHRTGEQFYPMQIVFSDAQRELHYAAIKLAKRIHNVGNSMEALAFIYEAFLAAHAEEIAA